MLKTASDLRLGIRGLLIFKDTLIVNSIFAAASHLGCFALKP